MVVQILIITITTITTTTTVTMRINLAGEVVKLLLLLPQSVLQVLLLLLQPGHLVIVIIKPGLKVIFWILDSLSGGTSNLLLVSSPGLEVGHLPAQAGDLVLLVLHVQLHCLRKKSIKLYEHPYYWFCDIIINQSKKKQMDHLQVVLI